MKRIYFLLFLLWGLHGSTSAQNPSLDSLYSKLESITEDSARLNLLNKICYAYLAEDITQAASIGLETYQLAIDKKYYHEAVRALSYSSYAFMQSGNVPKSLELAEKSLKIARKTGNDKTMSIAYGTLGNSYAESGQIEKAYEAYQKGLSIDERSGNFKKHSYTLHNLGVFKEETGDIQGAVRFYQASLKVALESGDERLIGEAYSSVAYGFLNTEDYDSAAYYFTESLKIARKYDEQLFVGSGLSGLADAESGRGRFEIANKIFEESLEIQTKMNDYQGVSHSLLTMANNCAKQGNHVKAIEQNLAALEYMERSNSLIGQPEVNKKISECYAAVGDSEKAYQYLKAAQVLSDSLFSSEKKQQLLEMEAKYQGEKNEAENKVLLAQQAENQAVIQQRTTLSIGAIMTLLLSCGLCFIYWRNNKQKKVLNEALELKVTERTASLAARNVELKNIVEELERFNHIASHDIKEPIRVMGSMAGLIRRRLPNEIREEMKQDFETIINGSKQLYTLMEDITNMSRNRNEPVRVSEFNVKDATENILQFLSKRIKASNAVVEYQGLGSIVSSESLVTIVIKNLIENGIKYNESLIPRVMMKYRKSEGYHVFSFRDNGMGIQPEYQEKIFDMFARLHNREISGSGIGLYNVKVAIEKLNGTIDLKSEMGKGTEFRVRLPMMCEYNLDGKKQVKVTTQV